MSAVSVSRSWQGLAVTGEIDESSFRFFAEALDALAGGMSPFHIDLAGVQFCDIAGLRLMVRLTRAGDPAGERKMRGGWVDAAGRLPGRGSGAFLSHLRGRARAGAGQVSEVSCPTFSGQRNCG
jgi:ABC-type transporter Mla MlaB component